MRIRLIPLAVLAVLLLNNPARAQVLPPPRVLPPAGPPVQFLVRPGVPSPTVLPPHGKPLPPMPLAALPYPVPGYQPSAYQVWQNYGWTYNGWIRPRAMQTANGGYWLYNGAPMPYAYVLPGRLYSSTIAPAGPATP